MLQLNDTNLVFANLPKLTEHGMWRKKQNLSHSVGSWSDGLHWQAQDS